jgi:AcrR family transcriptional regulator
MSADARREVIERAATEVFAERGYQAASMNEIARRSGVSVPVVYDHAESKQELHLRLLKRHYTELRAVWSEGLIDGPPDVRMATALDAWFSYVQTHPYAWRMLFRETTGEPAIQAAHQEVAAASRAMLLPLLAGQLGAEHIAGSADHEAIDMLWEIMRSVLQGLALWWYDHQHIPRERVVATAMNTLWVGFDRARSGEVWVSPEISTGRRGEYSPGADKRRPAAAAAYSARQADDA